MARWALLSGLRGDLAIDETVLADLRRQRVDTLFVLGDLIGPERDCGALLERLQHPRRGELRPHCLYGWWEEQLLAERGYRGERRAEALRRQSGEEAVQALLHGSSADVGDSLGSSSDPLRLLDRLTRMDVNRLFTARRGFARQRRFGWRPRLAALPRSTRYPDS